MNKPKVKSAVESPEQRLERERVLPPEFYAHVSIERARLAAERYRHLQFRTGEEKPRACIPANPDDDDLVLARFIDQTATLMEQVEQLEKKLKDAKLL